MSEDERKLYVIVRKDQPASVRAVMAIHVAADFALHHALESTAHYALREAWTEYGPPITLMTVRNRHRIERLAAEYQGEMPAWTYSDPDLDDGVCAIAIYGYHWNHDWARMAEFSEAAA